MINARTNGVDAAPTGTKPETITVSMILEDLESGIDRTGIQTKYNLEKWEVTQMFQHPTLKGKKAKKVKKLSFNFVDDTTPDPNQTSIPVETLEHKGVLEDVESTMNSFDESMNDDSDDTDQLQF